jgi:hypothetical protein
MAILSTDPIGHYTLESAVVICKKLEPLTTDLRIDSSGPLVIITIEVIRILIEMRKKGYELVLRTPGPGGFLSFARIHCGVEFAISFDHLS